MEYKEILDSARTCIGPYCKACPVCNGKACGNQVPGPGAKAPGSGFIRNFDAWQKICVNMDTICPNEPVDTAVDLFGTMYRYPFFAAPLGAMKLHYGEKYTDREYNSILVNACADSGIAAFTGDGVDAAVFHARWKPSAPRAASACRRSSRGTRNWSLKSSIWPGPAAARPSPWTLTVRASPS